MDNDLNGENFQFYRYPFRMPPKRFSKNNLAGKLLQLFFYK